MIKGRIPAIATLMLFAALVLAKCASPIPPGWSPDHPTNQDR